MKNWKNKPTNEEVEKVIIDFFQLLNSGKLDEAKNIINHKFNDWDSQIWSLWQDTYLIELEELDEVVEDESLEGQLWKNDLKWLNQLSLDEKFHWDEDDVFVNVIYNNILTDVSANFSIEKMNDAFVITRVSIS